MNDIEAKMNEAKNYLPGSSSAFAVADAKREGAEGVTELICSGDPAYLILIAVNIITEAAKSLDIPEERLNHMIESIRSELLEDTAGCPAS